MNIMCRSGPVEGYIGRIFQRLCLVFWQKDLTTKEINRSLVKYVHSLVLIHYGNFERTG